MLRTSFSDPGAEICITTLKGAAQSGGLQLPRGTLEDLKAVMDLFDKFDPAKNYTIPMNDKEF